MWFSFKDTRDNSGQAYYRRKPAEKSTKPLPICLPPSKLTEIAMGAFLGIEDAFNNAIPQSKFLSTERRGIDKLTCTWIKSVLGGNQNIISGREGGRERGKEGQRKRDLLEDVHKTKYFYPYCGPCSWITWQTISLYRAYISNTMRTIGLL